VFLKTGSRHRGWCWFVERFRHNSRRIRFLFSSVCHESRFHSTGACLMWCSTSRQRSRVAGRSGLTLGCQKVGVAAFSQLRWFCSVTRIEERSKASESGERQGASRRYRQQIPALQPAASALPLTTLLQRNKTGVTRNPLQHRIFASPALPRMAAVQRAPPGEWTEAEHSWCRDQIAGLELPAWNCRPGTAGLELPAWNCRPGTAGLKLPA
jgi:hypothetical protein